METSPSPSSPERGSLGTGDLAGKYTKLASEYSKVRAQLGVLKKAVLDEQSQKLHLSEDLREAETKARKSEAEMDALTFRNAQLTKRIEVLLSDSEDFKHHRHKRSSQSLEAAESVASVMGEELEAKIAENAKLHGALAEVDQRYDARMSGLQSHAEQLEAALKRQAQAERAEDTKQKELIHGLKADNVDLTARISHLERELNDANDRVTVLRVQMESAKTSAPIPLTATDAKVQNVEILSSLGDCVQNFVAAMSDLHTYWEHRLKDQGPLRDHSLKLSRLLLENVKHLRPIEQAYQQVLADALSNDNNGRVTASMFTEVAQNVESYVRYAVQDVEPLLISCLHHESNQSSCPPTQQARNGQLATFLKNYGQSLTSLADQLVQLTKTASGDDLLEAIENLTVNISQLDVAANELSKIYLSKATDEAKLPTVSDALRNTNQCIVAALASLTLCTSALSQTLSDNLPRIGLLITSKFQEDNDEKSNIKRETKTALTDANGQDEDPDRLNHDLEEQVGNLKHEVASLNERLKKAEQSKEHWKLECQLIQMKLDKVIGVNNEEDKNGEPPFYMSRVNELVSEKLLADSKAAHFYLECVSLQKRLKTWEKAKCKAEEKVLSAKEDIRALKEESATLTTNYEGQLSMMSEHVANMNDKLTSQTDHIERLKYELQSRKK